MNEFRNGEASAFDHLCLVLDLDVPLLPLAHLEQFIDHHSDAFHLLVWRLFDRIEKLSHGFSTISNRIWYAISETELCWNIYSFGALTNNYHWLVVVTHFQLVGLVEVLGNAHLVTILELEALLAWALLEVDIIDDVGALVSIVGDDALTDELLTTGFLETLSEVLGALIFELVVDLIDAAQNCLRGHESAAVVKDESTA